jgi:antitoxin component of MazEF toxin-antitoxin module
MIKKLVKHGNSWAVVIDRPILELLKIAPYSQVELTTEPKGNFFQRMTNGIQVHRDTCGVETDPAFPAYTSLTVQ